TALSICTRPFEVKGVFAAARVLCQLGSDRFRTRWSKLRPPLSSSRLVNRQFESELSPPSHLAFTPNLSFVLPDDVIGDGKSKTCSNAYAFGSESGVENLRQVLRRNRFAA